MKTIVQKSKTMLGLAAITSAMLGSVASANAAVIEANTMKQGVTFCGGNHSTRAGGTENSFTVYVLRNYSAKPMTITRFRIYDANGLVLRDFPSGAAFPGGFKTTLGPRQTTDLSTASVLPYDNSVARPLTVQINWQYQNGRRGIPLFTGVVRHFKSAADNKSLASFSASSNCFVRAN